MLNVLSIIQGSHHAGPSAGERHGRRGPERHDHSKSKSWSKSRGHKKHCKH